MLKKIISLSVVFTSVSLVLTAAPFSYAASISVDVYQNNIGGLNVPIGGSNVKIGEFDVQGDDDIWFFQARILCADAQGFKVMRLKYDGKTIGSAAAKDSLSSIGGLEANMYPSKFKLDKDKTYTFTVHADIADDAPNHTTACTIENSSRIRFKDMEDNNIISSRVNGNFGISEGTYPIYVESAEVVAEKKAAINSNSGAGSSGTDETDTLSEDGKTEEKEKPELPQASFGDEVLTAFASYKNPFPDTSLDNLVGRAAAELKRRNVLSGFPDGEFKGEELVNRAQLAKMLLVARYNQVEEVENNREFTDISSGQWYTSAVMDAANKSIINGYPDGTFKPADAVNTVEFLKMISKTFDIEFDLAHNYSDVTGEEWFAPYAGAAAKYNLFPDRATDTLRVGKELTRNEVAVAIYQYLLASSTN